jgi:hypothetical protein
MLFERDANGGSTDVHIEDAAYAIRGGVGYAET